jgi:hypothetical protein
LFEADQDDRREGKLSPGAGERDRERRKFVMSLLDDEFGTQYVDDGGVWDLYWVDPATTDDERAEWDVPTLTEAYELLAAMNEEERGKGATARE